MGMPAVPAGSPSSDDRSTFSAPGTSTMKAVQWWRASGKRRRSSAIVRRAASSSSVRASSVTNRDRFTSSSVRARNPVGSHIGSSLRFRETGLGAVRSCGCQHYLANLTSPGLPCGWPCEAVGWHCGVLALTLSKGADRGGSQAQNVPQQHPLTPVPVEGRAHRARQRPRPRPRDPGAPSACPGVPEGLARRRLIGGATQGIPRGIPFVFPGAVR